MWCEARQRQCGYLTVIEGAQQSALMKRATIPHVEEEGLTYEVETLTGTVEDVAAEWKKMAQDICNEDICGVLATSALKSLSNEAFRRMPREE